MKKSSREYALDLDEILGVDVVQMMLYAHEIVVPCVRVRVLVHRLPALMHHTLNPAHPVKMIILGLFQVMDHEIQPATSGLRYSK